MKATSLAMMQFLEQATGKSPRPQPFGPASAGYALCRYDDDPHLGASATIMVVAHRDLAPCTKR